MYRYWDPARRPAWNSGNESTNYNPFAKRITRLNPEANEKVNLRRAVPLDQAPQKPPYVSDDCLPPIDCPDVQPAYVPDVSGIIAQASIAGQIRSSW